MPAQCPICGSVMYLSEGGEKNYLCCGACGMKLFLTRGFKSLSPLHTPETAAFFKKNQLKSKELR